LKRQSPKLCMTALQNTCVEFQNRDYFRKNGVDVDLRYKHVSMRGHGKLCCKAIAICKTISHGCMKCHHYDTARTEYICNRNSCLLSRLLRRKTSIKSSIKLVYVYLRRFLYTPRFNRQYTALYVPLNMPYY